MIRLLEICFGEEKFNIINQQVFLFLFLTIMELGFIDMHMWIVDTGEKIKMVS